MARLVAPGYTPAEGFPGAHSRPAFSEGDAKLAWVHRRGKENSIKIMDGKISALVEEYTLPGIYFAAVDWLPGNSRLVVSFLDLDEPTEEYVVLRTLFHALSGKDAIGAMSLENDGVALVFDDTSSSCLLAWTWRDEPVSTPVELYLGQTASAVVALRLRVRR